MAEDAFMATDDGADLFDGLSSLDYSFLDGTTPREADAPSLNATNDALDMLLMKKESMEEENENLDALDSMLESENPFLTTTTSPPMEGQRQEADTVLFESELMETTESQPAVHFSMANQNVQLSSVPPSSQQQSPAQYHRSPTHKHKRVRSNPDVLRQLTPAQIMMLNAASPSNGQASPLARATMPPLQPPPTSPVMPSDVAQDAVFCSVMMSMDDIPAPLPISIGTINVSTPTMLKEKELEEANAKNVNASGSVDGMDAFLSDLPWSELSEASNATNTTSDPMTFRTQRIQEGVHELTMKRKRPEQPQPQPQQQQLQHTRHHSNPVDLLHNIDQFRILSQQAQPPSQQPPQVPPFGVDAQPMQAFIQMPHQMASNHGPASTHARRASMPASALSGMLASAGVNTFSNGTAPPPPPASRRGHHRGNRSTGLSMDLSHMNLGFLSVPEDQAAPSQDTSALPLSRSTSNVVRKNSGDKTELSDAAGHRKMYKCGRCGQPKVGHVCTMPDQRNNWTQVDLEITKGLKNMRTVNCHLVSVKKRWIVQHEDHVGG